MRTGLLQFRVGERERVIEVDVHADQRHEPIETFVVTLEVLPGLPEARGVATATVMIRDGG